MKNTIFSTLLLSFMIASHAIGIKAEEVRPSSVSQNSSDTISLAFRQGKSAIRSGFEGNDSSLQHIRQLASSLNNPDSLSKLRSVLVVGAASPEGSVAINRALSHRRADAIFDYLSDYVTLPDSITSFIFLGRDWTGLRKLVEADEKMPYREETIKLIDDILANHPNQVENNNLQRLKALHDGIPYRYMYRKFFPQLRKSSLIFDFLPERRLIPVPDFQPVLSLGIFDFTTSPISVPETCSCCHPFYMSLSTNMLEDLLLLPNISAEFYLGKNWSVVADWMYGWWDKDRSHYYWRAYGGDIGVRYWFGKRAAEKPLTGHHIGLYAGVVTYDFELGGRGYMGGRPSHNLWDRCNYLGGIEYGYSLPIARRLNLDFSIGIGYLGGKLLEYTPEDNHYVWQKTKRIHWFGPTKAEISLVWLIGCGNYNQRSERNIMKGGSL